MSESEKIIKLDDYKIKKESELKEINKKLIQNIIKQIDNL